MELIQQTYQQLRPGGVVLVFLLVISTIGWARAMWWKYSGLDCSGRHRSLFGDWLRKIRSSASEHPGKPPEVVRRLLDQMDPDGEMSRGELREYLRGRKKALVTDRRSGTHIVGVCSSVLLLLGLFGTLLGIIGAFDVLALFGSGEIRMLSEAISKALITTQAGLLLALPLLLFYRYMRSSLRVFTDNLELITQDIVRHRDMILSPDLVPSNPSGEGPGTSSGNTMTEVGY